MNYKYYIKQPMQMVERILNMIIAKNPQRINLLNRGSYHLLIRQNIHNHLLNKIGMSFIVLFIIIITHHNYKDIKNDF